MDQSRIDALTRALRAIPSRRDVMRSLAGAGLALGVAQSFGIADARKKRKRKNKKKVKPAKPNEYGCLEVGDLCTSEDQCCSGICEGKKGKKRCRAHDTGTCRQDVPGRCTAPNGEMESCNNKGSCNCYRTTAGSNACLEVAHADSTCSDCRTDADCLAMGLPPGLACVPVTEGICDSFCQSDMACLGPCPSKPPEA